MSLLPVRAHHGLVAAAIYLAAATSGSAQNPDLMLSKAERDSILKNYHNVFPIWGRKAIEKGFDLPYPAGLGVNFVYASQNIDLTNLGLSTGTNPVVPVDFIKFGETKAPVLTPNLRADLWVLPFLNVYAFGGVAWVTTDVEIAEPVPFTTKVEQSGYYAGLGGTATMGIKHNWLAFDLNTAWTKTEKLDEPVRARIFGIRLGRAQKLQGTQRVAIWLGAMKQTLKSTTNGSINLSEVIAGGGDGSDGGGFEDYEDSEWYQGLPPAQRRVVDEIVKRLQGIDPSDVVVNYSLDKATADPWNMIAGASYDFSKTWAGRAETGFIGRKSVLLMLNYRFEW